MSQFKTVFTLKQHTPIIHFQSEQSGATLRATELKPKFDRFLLGQVKDIPFKKNANGHKSLDYKVKIEANLSNAESINDRDPLFFGNMGDGKDKKFKIYTRNFKIEFFTFNSKVLDAIVNNFEAFLANTNFGTRQSKGFGSFYINDTSFNASFIPYTVYSFNTSNWKNDIGLLYQFLRQGINLPNREGTRFYSKPAIFSYALSKGWQWDKKSIKEAYFDNILTAQKEKHNSDILTYSSEEKYLLRDLFGLSSSQEWMSYGKTIEKSNAQTERFKSPITFKVVDGMVYFWANESVEQILNKTFNIKAGKENDNLNLSTPTTFSFNEFFTFTFNINLSTHIENQYHDQSEFRTLDRIFKSIKSRL